MSRETRGSADRNGSNVDDFLSTKSGTNNPILTQTVVNEISSAANAGEPKLRYMESLLLNFLQVPGQVLLIEGAPGTGKTSLALEILNRMEDSHKIYASSRVSPEKLRQHFPWINEVMDSMTGRTARAVWLDEFHDFRSAEPDSILSRVLRLKQSKRKSVLVIDSWEGAVRNVNEEGRTVLESALLADLDESKVSIVIVTETEKHDHLDYLVDGIVQLNQSEIDGRRIRSMELRKLRGFQVSTLRGLFTLIKGRFTLLPQGPTNGDPETPARLVPIPHKEDKFSTGISDLDRLLGGGAEKGSVLLIDIDTDVPPQWMKQFLTIIRANFVNQGGACFIVPTGGYSSDNVEETLRPLVGEAAVNDRVRIAAYSRNPVAKEWRVQLTGKLLEDIGTFARAWGPMSKYKAGNIVSVSLDRMTSVYGDDLTLPAMTDMGEGLRDSGALQICTTTLRTKVREETLRSADYHLKVENDGGSFLIYGIKPFTAAFAVESNRDKGYPAMTLTPVV